MSNEDKAMGWLIYGVLLGTLLGLITNIWTTVFFRWIDIIYEAYNWTFILIIGTSILIGVIGVLYYLYLRMIKIKMDDEDIRDIKQSGSFESKKEEFIPDFETLKRLIPRFRNMHDWHTGQSIVSSGHGSTADRISDRVNFELTLLRYQTQERLIDTLERSIESQDKLAKAGNFLAMVAIVFAAIEIIVEIIIPFILK